MGITLGVYWATMSSSLTWSHWGTDAGDFITAAVTGRLPHPPGFPLYMGIVWLFVRIPWRDPAWCLNFFSAVMGAGTVGLIAAILRQRGAPSWRAAIVALTLAFAPLFWSQAIITEVYTCAAFFMVLAWYMATVEDAREQRSREAVAQGRRGARGYGWCLLMGLMWGLAISVHATLILLAPLWSAYLWKWVECRESRITNHESRIVNHLLHFTFHVLPLFLFGFLLGLLPYALLPFSGSWPQPWGDLRSWAGWWEWVTARLYWGYAFALPLVHWPRRALAWGILLTQQFTPVGAALILVGISVLWRYERALLLGILVSLGLGSLYAIGYNTPDSLVYLVPLLPLCVLLLDAGLAWFAVKGVPLWLSGLLPLILLIGNWGAVSLHQDRVAIDWLRQTWPQVPSRAVLVTEQERYTFTLWYGQEALSEREDVLLVDRNLWGQPAYRAFLMKYTGMQVNEIEEFAVGRPLCYIEREGEVLCP
ncbi:MAG: DUF2723 domain-containing protein [Anaerolineae bacterium]|nr:DUF2723 domain-containing protein [Anaerolineae bacterium]